MGTRGIYGFFYKGKFYCFYNHWDSYPRGLGVTLLKELVKIVEEGRLNEWKEKLELLINRDYSAAKDEPNNTISFENILKDCEPENEPPWEQYAYVINFDEDMFEFYRKSNLAIVQPLALTQLKQLLVVFESSLNNY